MVQEILVTDNGTFPGNRLPALLYKAAVEVPLFFPAKHIKAVFEQNGWKNSWDAGIFTYHHYHSLTHEVLGIYNGHARLQLGGNNGPVLTLEKGDVLVIPAGVAHKNLDNEHTIGVVGAYPNGMAYDMNYGKPGERPGTDKHIANVPLPNTDPINGTKGELLQHWNTTTQSKHNED